MPNVFKYSPGATGPGTLKKGDFLIGNNTADYGGTYYTGITPATGGYTIYLNKSVGGPSIFTAANDSVLIDLTNKHIAGNPESPTGYTTAAQCLGYFAGQSDKVCVNRDYEEIVTRGLVLGLDAGFNPSYPTSGSSWYDLGPNSSTGTLINGPIFSSSDGGSIVFDGVDDNVTFPSSFNATTAGLNGFHSVEMWLKPYRVAQQNDGLFRCSNTGSTNGYLHYIIRNSRFYLGWYSIDTPGTTVLSTNTWYHVVFMFDSDMRQKIYLNGVIDATGSVLSNFFNGGTAPIQLAFYASYYQGLMPIVRVYNRGLSASEVLRNFNAQKSRFGL